MKDPLTRLKERTAALGNYNLKYLHVISSVVDRLEAALEQHAKHDRVHLWTYTMEIPGEMDTILEVAADDNERLDFLGCYFALQFLHMNLRMVDVVKVDLAAGPHRWRVGRRLMLESGRMFRFLTKCYMERLLRIFLNEPGDMEYAILGVGTRADQDDIDLGIIHRDPDHAGTLNRAISRLANEMFKKSTRLHFHLSEHVGENSLTATIQEYEEILEKDRYDFVIVTEMLGAAVILGSYPLFEEFKTRVTRRFYFDSAHRQNRFHEGYARGILGEIHSLLNQVKLPATINPKDDGLRPIKSTLSALRLVYDVDKTNAWHIIDDLKQLNSERIHQYDDLEQTLSFFELFRHLYQIMVAQDEEIDLSEPGIGTMMTRIARMMGFDNKGVIFAEDFMLVNYYELLDKTIEAINVLTEDLKKHLRDVSIFRPIFHGDIHRKPGYKGNLAVDFIRASTFVRGITYWDDFQEELSAKDNVFYNEFVTSFNQLPERIQRKVSLGYVAAIKHDPSSVLRFLVILGQKAKTEPAQKVFKLISRTFVDELDRFPGASAALTQILYASPGVLNSFLALLEWDDLAKIVASAHRPSVLPKLAPVHHQLLTLVNVHYQSSHFFKWHFYQILNKYPMFIKNLHRNDKLKEITDGFFSDLTSLPSLQERVERLGDYYDLEFVRVSLLAMAGAGREQTDAEFIEFCDNYTLSLYEFCQQEVHLSLGYSLHTQDLFALFAAGGHAREQGFDDDYDMIAILDSSDTEKVEYCNMIIGKMNSQILKRGILPHHRFADHFGSYVISLEQLTEFLSSEGDEIFVDQSQILSARLLVGTHKLEQKLQDRIVYPRIFARNREYIDHMKAEMQAHRRSCDEEIKDDIKECGGGLRDIEMLLLMYEAKYQIREPLSRRFLRRLVELEPEHANEFQHIERHWNFIKNLRDLYRLKVAAHNIISREFLPPVAETMGYGSGAEGAANLYSDYVRRTKEAARVIDALVDTINV